MNTKPKVGMQIRVEPEANNIWPYPDIITSVGRKWAKIGDGPYRMNVKTWELDGGGKCCYLNTKN